MRPNWYEHAMNIAEATALRSEDRHYKVGACLLDAHNAVLSVGYNGTLSGVWIDWEDREKRRRFVIHAEQNCLRYATPSSAHRGLMAVTHHPCVICVREIAAYGIRRIVWRVPLDWSVYDRDEILSVANLFKVVLMDV